MGKRTRLGVIYSYNDKWIGGSYYIMNMISALKTLPDESQPFIIILSNDIVHFNQITSIGYRYLSYVNPYNVDSNIFIKQIRRWIINYNIKKLLDKILLKFKIDVLFPANNESCYSLIKNKIYWVPDFQHLLFPENFSDFEIERRLRLIKSIALSEAKLLLSSKTAKQHWDSLAFEKKCSVVISPFAVTHPDISNIDYMSLADEFSLKKPYFIVSNQFWRHKNHFIVLEAIFLLFRKGYDFEIVFTGNYIGQDCENTFKKFYDFCKNSEFSFNVKILGLINRDKQLALMNYSLAVIQPSFFEGWSTVVEDAKSLSKFIIASDIEVHREQLSSNVLFFDPLNSVDLSECCLKVLRKEVSVIKYDYSIAIKNFGIDLHTIFK